MKKYIQPEMEILKFESEVIMTDDVLDGDKVYDNPYDDMFDDVSSKVEGAIDGKMFNI